MVHAHDQQLGVVALVVDAKRREGPTSHKRAGSQTRDRAVEFLGRQPVDALRDLSVETYRSCWIAFVEVTDRLNDVDDRLLVVGAPSTSMGSTRTMLR